MLSTRFNTANMAALGPLLTTILVGLDLRFSWGMGNELMTAFAMAVMWLLTSITPDKGFIYKPEASNPNLKVSIVPLIGLFLLFLLLSGCSLLPYGPQAEALIDQAREQGVVDRKKFNDDKRDLILELGCDVSLGSAGRMEDKAKQFYLLRHCGIEVQPPAPPVVFSGPQS